MKHPTRLLMTVLLCLCCLPAGAQEFSPHRNGFIYSDTTMKQLHTIVDSMNLKYRRCDLYKDYYALAQSTCRYVRLDTGNIRQAKADLESGISYEQFIARYPRAVHKDKLLVLRDAYEDYEDKRLRVQLKTYEPGSDYGPELTLKDTTLMARDTITKWLIDYTKKDKYAKEEVEAMWLLQPFAKQKLPEKWARAVLYADCMIDTGQSIYTEGARRTGRGYLLSGDEKDIPGEVTQFIKYAHQISNYPSEAAHKKDFWEAAQQWDSTRFSILDKQAADPTTDFYTKLREAADAAVKADYGNSELEEYTERYYSPAKALRMKRSRIVVGGCSMDQSPRYHAFDIARLAAESVSWEIFLRAHLDIMNDNFSRVSDGSYAWGARQTYIREIEGLDLDIPTLITGISVRISNPSGTHYYGDISRLGRALAESDKWLQTEEMMASIMSDEGLDDFNRLLGYYLYSNYLWHLKDKTHKAQSIVRFRTATMQLPAYLAQQAAAHPQTFEEE